MRRTKLHPENLAESASLAGNGADISRLAAGSCDHHHDWIGRAVTAVDPPPRHVMIDIHCHILPGVDDGAEDLSEAAEMCRQAANSGCKAMIATPHQRHPQWWNTDQRRLEVLLEQVQHRAGPKLQLHLGGEVRVDARFLGALERLTSSGVLPLAGSKYLMLEFERRRMPLDPVEVVQAVIEAGWWPIVAHPEFIPGVREDIEMAERLVEANALLQITGGSVLGEMGESARHCVTALLDRGLVHFIASDGHDTYRRPTELYRPRIAVAAKWGRDTAHRLLSDNPRAILDNRRIEARPASA